MGYWETLNKNIVKVNICPACVEHSGIASCSDLLYLIYFLVCLSIVRKFSVNPKNYFNLVVLQFP